MCWSPLQHATLIWPAAIAAAPTEVKNLENTKVQEQQGNLYGGISHWYFLVYCGDLNAVFILKGLLNSCIRATSKRYLEKKASFFCVPEEVGERLLRQWTESTAECLLASLLLAELLWYRIIFILCWESLSKLGLLSPPITSVGGQSHLSTFRSMLSNTVVPGSDFQKV